MTDTLFPRLDAAGPIDLEIGIGGVKRLGQVRSEDAAADCRPAPRASHLKRCRACEASSRDAILVALTPRRYWQVPPHPLSQRIPHPLEVGLQRGTAEHLGPGSKGREQRS